jgi:hypothetical protein
MSNFHDWQKIQDWVNEHSDLLIMVADPRTDTINTSYGGLNAFVRFPMESMEKGVVFNALHESNFKEAIDPLIFGVVDSTKMNEKAANQLLHVIGGSIKSLGVERENIKRDIIRKNLKKDNGKTKKSRK